MRLILLRHAKSDRDEHGLPDHERSLSSRGNRDAPIIGAYMHKSGLTPDRVLCSTAIRARQTWSLVADFLPATPCSYLDEMYEFGLSQTVIDIARTYGGSTKALCLVGHNPTLHNAALALIGSGPDKLLRRLMHKLPTASLCEIALTCESWQTLEPGDGKLINFVRPKDLYKFKSQRNNHP